jgi:oligopeptide transport system permease protein
VYKYILRRLLQMIPVLLGATFIIFAMVFALPGDPTAGMCGDRPCSPTFIAQFKKEHNLNDPLLVRYGKYMANVAQGDLGTNFRNIKVQDDLKTRYPTTIKLAGMAIIFETVLGIIAGVLAGVRKGKFIDQLVLVSTLVVISVPVFVIGATLQYYLGVKARLFPVTVSTQASFYELLLPAIVLGSISLAYVARLTRTNLTENLRADYVRTAIAKGLTRRRAVGLHALRNSLIPVVTIIGIQLPVLVGGSVVLEQIFSLPGMGFYYLGAINQRDFTVIQAVTVIAASVVIVSNLLVDLSYPLFDPRIRYS